MKTIAEELREERLQDEFAREVYHLEKWVVHAIRDCLSIRLPQYGGLNPIVIPQVEATARFLTTKLLENCSEEYVRLETEGD